MKDQNFLSKHWKNKNLQARLVLVFTLLFGFCMIAMSVFLLNVLQLIAYHNQARSIFESTRQVFQLESMLKQYQLDLTNYGISASPLAEQQLAALDIRIDESITALQTEFPAENAAQLRSVADQKRSLSALAERIIAAVDEQGQRPESAQDWEQVAQLDAQAVVLFNSLYADVGAIRTNGITQLQSLRDEAEIFSGFAFFLGILAIPAFLILALGVALITYTQINLPAAQLTRAAGDLQARQFEPAMLARLSQRSDEIGVMAREFIHMAAEVAQRSTQLQQEAAEIRGKIR